MQDRSWSLATFSKESFPKLDGEPKYLAYLLVFKTKK